MYLIKYLFKTSLFILAINLCNTNSSINTLNVSDIPAPKFAQ